jgi:sugar lactone lactonase YvrE
MKQRIIIGGLLFGIALSAAQLWAAHHLKLASGEVEVLYEFVDPDPGEFASPEGIAFDQAGNMYISLRTKTSDTFVNIGNEVIKLTPAGEESVLADLGPIAAEGAGLLGLETDAMGNVYAAFSSNNENHGVWKISADGEMELLAGSDQILAPNGLTFDARGNLYVTDSRPDPEDGTGVWRYGREEKVFEPWASHPLLLTGGPQVGANGIVFDPPNHLYVANTQENLVAHVTVNTDGSAGEVSLLAAGPPVIFPDGLALDAHGNVYVAIPVSTFPAFIPLPPTAPVLRIVPETGVVEPILPLDFPDGDYFDFPTSLAFGKGPWDHESVYVVGISQAGYGLPATGPKLTQVGVGIPGQTRP